MPKDYAVSEQRNVPVERLDEVIQLIPPGRFRRVDHLKTDCQGTDIDVLRGSIGILETVAVVTSEAESRHYFNCINREEDIDSLLVEKGFVWLNRPSALRSTIRRTIDKSPKFFRFAISQLHIRLMPGRRAPSLTSKTKVKIDVVDPTWTNKSFTQFIQSGEITARQWN